MPNYDIISMAVDLLDYTIQRVKPKEAEYKPVKAFVMENGLCRLRPLLTRWCNTPLLTI